jgi:hypothetical protein
MWVESLNHVTSLSQHIQILNELQSAQPIKGLFMIGNWRSIIGAILLLGSGCLFLFISPYVSLTRAYLVSLPVFAIGVIIAWRGGRKPPES